MRKTKIILILLFFGILVIGILTGNFYRTAAIGGGDISLEKIVHLFGFSEWVM